MKTPLGELVAMAQAMHDEGFTRSEAYPIKRWKKNGWPEVEGALAFKVMDAYLRLRQLEEEYERDEEPVGRGARRR